MAKQTVGPVVRHVEKAVLALAAGAFLYIVATHGVVSPNKVGPEGEKMGPAEVDTQVKASADRLREKLLRADPSPDPVPQPMPRLRKASDPLTLAGVAPVLPRPVPYAPTIPDFSARITAADTVELIKVVQLGKPRVEPEQHGRSGVFLAPPADFSKGGPGSRGREEGDLQDVNWVTVAAPFDRKRQEQLCRQAGYDPKRVETVFLGVDIERRVLGADGSYTDWRSVNAVSLRGRPVYPEPEVYKAEKGYNVSDEQRGEVEEFFRLIQEDENQLALMRPLFPKTAYGADWRYPKPAEYNVLKMDAEYQDIPHCRYPECAALAEQIDPKRRFKNLLEDAEEALKDQKFDMALAYAEAAKNKAERDSEREEAENLLKRIKQRKQVAAGGKRARLDAQLLWAHDAGIGSVRSGRTYQYRMRARIYNRYCGTPTLLANPQDAQMVELVGPWSEPSDPISIPLDTLVFLKSDKPAKQQCKVEVFKWVGGQWLMKAFNVGVGDHIGGPARVPTPNGPREEVNFDTGATVVDIDFNRPFRARSKKGAKLGSLTETAALVYVGATGQLHEQLLALDKNSTAYKNLKRSYYRPPRHR